MKLKFAARFAGLCVLGFAAFNASACYTVYDKASRVIYQGLDAPVDMSLPLHETLGRTHPGAHMVFDTSNTCTPVTIAQVPRRAVSDAPRNTIRREGSGIVQPVSTNTMGAGPATNAMGAGAAPAALAKPAAAPLLTDRRTAASLHLPHTVVQGEIVMVPAYAAAQVHIPSVTVVPAAVATTQIANPSTAAMGAGPAPAAAKKQTVITEMRNPPVTIVQRGSDVSVIRN